MPVLHGALSCEEVVRRQSAETADCHPPQPNLTHKSDSNYEILQKKMEFRICKNSIAPRIKMCILESYLVIH